MKILCYGDSNTYGYDPRSLIGDRYPAWFRLVDLLAEKLNSQVVNAGENGRQIPRRVGERTEVARMLTNEKPVDLRIIMLGTNDLLQGNSPEAVAERMEGFLKCIDLDRSRILLVAPPPMKRGEWVPSRTLIDASMALNREYEALSRRMGVGFADGGAWGIPMAFDGVHFTEEGHRIFAERLAVWIDCTSR